MTLSRTTRVCLLAIATLACAAPIHAQPTRPRVGVAFGGGSARGLAHIGVVRWLEEHHVPIDVAAGTSMGGLVGGGFAAGMSAEELRALIAATDWDALFGSSSFAYKNLRRKEDARDYPSRLEFGVKRGIVAPTALNSGQQVDFLLSRIAAGYPDLDTFDRLPTPFRTVAVDLRTGERVVIDRGSLAEAMRATMSLPGVFPPVEAGSRVLVDGGALDNVPADVVRDMGAAFVIAIDVGNAPDDAIDYSMFGLLGDTVDAMMRANTRRALQSADLIISVDVRGFGSLDWRRSAELVEQGYKAAEQHRTELLRSGGRRRGVAEVDRRPAAAPARKRGGPHICGDVRHRCCRRRRDQAAAGASRRTAAQRGQLSRRTWPRYPVSIDTRRSCGSSPKRPTSLASRCALDPRRMARRS